MSVIYIMRHGEAEQVAPSDALRPLTPLGRQEATAAATHLINDRGEQAPNADLVVVASPYVRAQQTAKIVLEALNYTQPLITSDQITPDISARYATKALDGIISGADGKDLLVVSHMPLVSELINHLVWGDNDQRVAMGTAYVAKLKSDVVACGMAELQWVNRPG